MSYAMPADMEARYPARDLIQLTNEVTPLVLTFNAGDTITLPYSPLSLVFVQSQLEAPFPLTTSTYQEGPDYTVNRTTGMITRVTTGSIAAGATVYVSTDNPTFIQTFLDDATDEIDSIIRTRFALPLTNIPREFTRFCCDIAMYRIQQLRPIHDLARAQKVYDEDIHYLDLVRTGERNLSLSLLNLEIDAPNNPSVVFVNSGGDPTGTLPQRVFNRGSLIGM